MARYDGSPDAFPGLRDASPDLNLDRWPDPPVAADEDTERHDDWADGDDSAERVVDLRTAADPADWVTSYGASTSSFSLDAPAAERDVPPAEDILGTAPHQPIGSYEPAYEPAYESTYESTYEPTYEPGYEPAPEPVYEGRRRQPTEDVPETVAPAPVATDEDWGIPPVPIGASLSGAESLTADSVLYTPRERPQSGWRKRVYSMTGGKINFGPSPADRHLAGLIAAARTPITDCHRLAVISLKGGVGKTTTTAALGAMFATLRADRVIAVDANPDRGTLGERLPRESGATVRHLLAARYRLQRYADVRRFTSLSPTRLEVLASDADPSASLAFSEQDYRDTVATLERFYNLILTDCGTGLLHSAMHGILGLANSLVVVSSASLDGARSASATLDWLEAHNQGALAREAVVVISSVRPGGGIVDVLQLEDHFAARCRAVIVIPYDPHLEAGGVLDLDELAPDTLDAYRELAASVAEGFPSAVR
jgi:MinD-like ATPase involved in chromosome partitioning or flagellar assembly